METRANKLVVERFSEMVDAGDLSQLGVVCTADIVNHALAPGRPNGIDGTRDFLTSPGRLAQAGRWVEGVVVAEGDYIVEYGVRAGNWPAGPFRGFDVPGRPTNGTRIHVPARRRAHRRAVGSTR